MRCYEFNEFHRLVRGISVSSEEGAPRFQLPPYDQPMYFPHAFDYNLGFSMPLLHSELADKISSVRASEPFVVPEVRLDRCDIEQRAEPWAIPESQELQNFALVLAITLEGRPAVWADLHVVGAGSEILAKSPASRRASGTSKPLEGAAALVKLAPGGILRITRQYRYRKIFGADPKVEYSLQCQPDGSVRGFAKNHPKLASEILPVIAVPFRYVPLYVPTIPAPPPMKGADHEQ